MGGASEDRGLVPVICGVWGSAPGADGSPGADGRALLRGTVSPLLWLHGEQDEGAALQANELCGQKQYGE